MSIGNLLKAIEGSALAHAISKSHHLVAAALQVIHVLGFIVLLASLLLLCLRLLNVVLGEQPVSHVARDATRLLYFGLTLAVASGTLLFIATPTLYFYKPVFELKMLLFAIALAVQFTLFRSLTRRTARPAFVRTTVALSLTTWFAIGFAGRMIGFT